MKNHLPTEMPTARGPQANTPPGTMITELTDAELQAVPGGINPQPLPPRASSNHLA